MKFWPWVREQIDWDRASDTERQAMFLKWANVQVENLADKNEELEKRITDLERRMSQKVKK